MQLALSAKPPKTRKGKKVLEARQPTLVESAKQVLLVKGGNASSRVTNALKDLYSLKKPEAVLMKRKNIMRPFEDEAPLERFATKMDCSLFIFGSNSKKRPNSLVFGRTFDGHVLDMAEFSMEIFEPISQFHNEKVPLGTKHCLMFAGEHFDLDPTLQRVQSLLIDVFRGPVVKQIRLNGLQSLISFTCDDPKRIRIRCYRVILKKSGTRTPRVELEEIGPRFDLRLGRTKFASDDAFKRACKQPLALKPKKVKNIAMDPFGSKTGRIHMRKQDLAQLQTRKMKGLKRSSSGSRVVFEPSSKARRSDSDSQ